MRRTKLKVLRKMWHNKNICMHKSVEFIGQLLGSSILEYIIISFIFTVLFALFLNKFIWIILWENIILITMTLLLPIFIDFVIKFTSSYIIINEIIYDRILFQLIDIYQIICACLN